MITDEDKKRIARKMVWEGGLEEYMDYGVDDLLYKRDQKTNRAFRWSKHTFIRQYNEKQNGLNIFRDK